MIYGEEQLPVAFTAADIPERCLSCPGLLMRRIVSNSDEGADISSALSDEKQVQEVSDAVRQMQICTTGPVEQHDYRLEESTRPYWDFTDKYLPRDFFQVGFNKMVKTDNEGKRVVIETGWKKLPKIVKLCGLEAFSDRVPASTDEDDPEITTDIESQRKSLDTYKEDVELAINPRKHAKPGEGDGARGLLEAGLPEEKQAKLSEKRLARVNRARRHLGMLHYQPPVEAKL